MPAAQSCPLRLIALLVPLLIPNAAATAAEEYRKWSVAVGPAQLPLTPTGTGLPTSLINGVLVARDGNVYAALEQGQGQDLAVHPRPRLRRQGQRPLGIAAFVVLTAAAHSQTSGQFSKALETKETDLISDLANETVWKDVSQNQKILDDLMIARKLRPNSIIPILVKQIAWSPNPTSGNLMTDATRFPCMGTLVEIGLPAAPALLDELKRSDPSDGKLENLLKRIENPKAIVGDGTAGLRHYLALRCLVAIYDKGGHGVDLAKQRIDLELKAVPEKAQGYLKHASSTVLELRVKLP